MLLRPCRSLLRREHYNMPEEELRLNPPMSVSDALIIAGVVEERIRLYIPSVTRTVLTQTNTVVLTNPENNQMIQLIAIFRPETHGSVGFRVWTLEAVPDLLKHLLGHNIKDTGHG